MAKKNDIVIRSLSMAEYDEFQDYVEKLEEENVPTNKQMRKIAMYIGETIYGLNPNDNSVSVATFMMVLNETMEKTNSVNEAEIKNLKVSGNGVSVAE